MKKIIFFLLISGFCFAQQTKICNLSESDLQTFSEKLVSGSGITNAMSSKKTSLGYILTFEKDLKITFTNDGGKYSLYDIQGKNEYVKNVWKSFFNPNYNDQSREYSNTILKNNGSDIRLQKINDNYYIEKYSCQN